MIILGFETSCDETSASVIEGEEGKVFIKSNIIASSLSMHAATGGVIPEVAARAQLKFMLPVLQEALDKASHPQIDAIAVTYGPGLIGSLLVGIETARTFAYVWHRPIVAVNHLIGHVYANFISNISVIARSEATKQSLTDLSKNPRDYHARRLRRLARNDIKPEFPLIALVVSGGHTDLLYMKQHGDLKVLGGTRDDAAGEAFDKIGRLLGLAYPAGPVIEERAKHGNQKRFHFPRPLLRDRAYDFSFSGLKTAVLREILTISHPEQSEGYLNLFQKNLAYTRDSSADPHLSSKRAQTSSSAPQNDNKLDEQTINDIAAGAQRAIVDVLVKKTLRATEEYGVKSIVVSGGVAANEMLRGKFKTEMLRQKSHAKLFFPPKIFCTDNAAMIATAAYFNYKPTDWRKLQANPELYY